MLLLFSFAAITSAARFDTAMLPTYETLAKHLLGVNARIERPHWVCVAGGPGAGKSTLCAAVAAMVNKQSSEEIAVVLPMDGFHYSRAELKQLDPPDAATYMPRRGSPGPLTLRAATSALRMQNAMAKRRCRHSRELRPGARRRDAQTISSDRTVRGQLLPGADWDGERERWAPLTTFGTSDGSSSAPTRKGSGGARATSPRQRLVRRECAYGAPVSRAPGAAPMPMTSRIYR